MNLDRLRQQHLNLVFDRQLLFLELDALRLFFGGERKVRVDGGQRFFQLFVPLSQGIEFGHRSPPILFVRHPRVNHGSGSGVPVLPR
jgi:hypothetical protein